MISLGEARRIALAALGFGKPRPRRVDGRQIARTIRHLGLVQIDFVNVLIPAPYLVLFSRLGPYDRTRFDEVVHRGREFTEQWAHEASLVPMDTLPLFRNRVARMRVRPYGFETLVHEHPEYVDRVHAQVREHGPLTASDLPWPDGVDRRMPDAWFRSVPRAVLEALFLHGHLAVAGRRSNFARVYDIAERVIPLEIRERSVAPEDADRQLIRHAARAYGIAAADDLADYYRIPLREAQPRIAELVAAGELSAVQVEGWRGTAYLDPSSAVPRKIEAAALLSPFDPVVWYRARAARLFDFDYRIGIYTPAALRKDGYYVLPFLLGDRLAARADLKADRKQRRLVVESARVEAGNEGDEVAGPLAKELGIMAGWLGLDSVTIARKSAFERRLAALC